MELFFYLFFKSMNFRQVAHFCNKSENATEYHHPVIQVNSFSFFFGLFQ